MNYFKTAIIVFSLIYYVDAWSPARTRIHSRHRRPYSRNPVDFRNRNKMRYYSEEYLTGRSRGEEDLIDFHNILKEVGDVGYLKQLRLAFYGNFCGLDGNDKLGRDKTRNVEDPCDNCCRNHDDCYGKVDEMKCADGFSVYRSGYKYEPKGKDICGKNEGCRKSLCECDLEMSYCIKTARMKKLCPNF